MENRLAAIAALSNSIVREVETLKAFSASDFESGDLDMEMEVQRLETDLIRCALLRTAGNMTKAAKLLKLKYTTFYSKVRRYGLGPEDPTKGESIDNFKCRWETDSYPDPATREGPPRSNWDPSS